MTWFPIIGDELDRVERQLGIALSPGVTMQTFVEATTQFRRTLQGFPPDGVLATLPEGRYVRFWLPDTKAPGTLGELIYSWDTHRHREARDCTGERWVQRRSDTSQKRPSPGRSSARWDSAPESIGTGLRLALAP